MLSIMLCLLFGTASSIPAQQATPSPGEETKTEAVKLSEQKEQELTDPETLETLIENLDTRIERANLQAAGESPPPPEVPAEELQQRATTLSTLQTLYKRLLTALDKSETLAKELQRLQDAKAEQAYGIEKEPPFALSFYDSYLDTIQTLQQQKDSTSSALTLAETSLQKAKEQLGQTQQSIRRLKEQVAAVAADQAAPKLTWDLNSALLNEEVEEAMIAFQTRHVANLETEQSILDNKMEITKQASAWIKEHLHYSEEDLNKQTQHIDEEIQDVQKGIEGLKENLQKVEKAYLRAQTKVDQAVQEQEKRAAEVELGERRAWRDYYQRALEQKHMMLDLLNTRKHIWTQRYALLQKKHSAGELRSLRDNAAERDKRLDESLLSQEKFQSSVQSQMATAQNTLQEENLPKPFVPHIQSEVAALKETIQHNLNLIAMMRSVKSLNQRLLKEVESRLGSVQIAQKVSAFSKEKLLGIWYYELWTAGDHAVTVGKLFIALVLIILGFMFSRMFSRLVQRRLLVKFDVELDAAQAIQRGLFFVLVLSFTLAALRTVNIPLTAFAFLGGAFALGLGFGAQKLLSNLISGVLIMLQRPFRINDIVEIDGTLASVQDVDSRYTRIRDFNNIDVLIPNSYMLDHKIINWTHSDKRMRNTLTVGVSYDDDVELVRELLLQVANSNIKVLKDPAPFVIFRDFGDSALIFDLYFWVDMNTAFGFKVQSEMRFAITRLFRRHHITIAYPQMDVHLDTPPSAASSSGGSTPRFPEKEE